MHNTRMYYDDDLLIFQSMELSRTKTKSVLTADFHGTISDDFNKTSSRYGWNRKKKKRRKIAKTKKASSTKSQKSVEEMPSRRLKMRNM